MTSYLTCHNCAVDRNECATRAILRQSIKGLHITSVRHSCPDRVSLFRVGQRVSVTFMVNETDPNDCYGPEAWEASTWPATVIKEKDGKFIVCVDDVESDIDIPASGYFNNSSRYAKVRAGKLKPLKEPSRPVCGLCGNLEGNLAGCWDESARQDGYRYFKPEPRCLANILAGTSGQAA